MGLIIIYLLYSCIRCSCIHKVCMSSALNGSLVVYSSLDVTVQLMQWIKVQFLCETGTYQHFIISLNINTVLKWVIYSLFTRIDCKQASIHTHSPLVWGSLRLTLIYACWKNATESGNNPHLRMAKWIIQWTYLRKHAKSSDVYALKKNIASSSWNIGIWWSNFSLIPADIITVVELEQASH